MGKIVQIVQLNWLITLVENFVQLKHSNHVMYFDQLSQIVQFVQLIPLS